MFPRLDCKVDVVVNDPPVVSVGVPGIEVVEGDFVSVNGTFNDPDGDTVTFGSSVGSVINNNDGTWTWSYNPVDGPIETQVIQITANDGVNEEQSVGFQLTVRNDAPIVQAAPPVTVVSGSDYTFSGTFRDKGVNDSPWNWSITWGDGSQSQGSTPDQSAPIVATKNVCAIGSFPITLEVTDKDGAKGAAQTFITVDSVPVDIMISSSDKGKPVNANSKGRLPISILGSLDFDVSTVDLSSLLISSEMGTGVPVAQKPNGTYFASLTDINDDGVTDLLIHVEVDALNEAGSLATSTNELIVTGSLSGGCTQFEGKDSIRVIL